MPTQSLTFEASTDPQYDYGVKLGSPKDYRLFLGYGNYFYKDQGKTRVLTFPSMGNFYPHRWAKGTNSISVFSKALLPDGVMLKWFSPFEDQIWKGKYDFDPSLMARLKAHRVNNLLMHFEDDFFDPSIGFSFVINVIPGGVAFIWVSSGGETYLLKYGYGVKTDEDQWARYIRALGPLKPITRQELIEERLSLQSEAFQQAYREGTLDLTPDRWLRKMTRYPWKIVGNKHYKIKDFFARFTNGEQFHIYEKGGNPIRTGYAPPYELFVFIEGTDEKKRYERVRVLLDEEVVVKAFEKVADLKSDLPIELQISFNYEINKVHIYLTQGDRREKIEFLKAYLEDI